MKHVDKMGAQGDLLVMRVNALPSGLTEEKHSGRIIAAHSETGHHHIVECEAHEAKLFRGQDPFTCYLQLAGTGAEVVHHRPWDTHETLGLTGPGIFMLRNQREYEPEGWRRVAD